MIHCGLSCGRSRRLPKWTSISQRARWSAWEPPKSNAAIAKAVEELIGSRPKTVKTYELGDLADDVARDALNDAFPQIEFLASPDPAKLVVRSTAKQHPQIKEALDQLIQAAPDMARHVRVFTIDRKKATAEMVAGTIPDDLRESVFIQVNDESNSIVVRGRDEALSNFSAAIESIVGQLPEIPKATLNVYQFSHVDPDIAESALQRLFPRARYSDDRETGTLSVTALPEEHLQIAALVKELDVPGKQSQRSTEIYRFDRTSNRSAEYAFERLVPRARVSSIYGTNALIATATDAEHKIFRETAGEAERRQRKECHKSVSRRQRSH